MKKKIFYSVLVVIILTNLPLWTFLTTENFCYQNIDGSFNVCEERGKGISFTNCIKHYGFFLGQHPEKDKGDNKLYRTFAIKPWKFWEWREYIFHSDRFALPYLEPDQKK